MYSDRFKRINSFLLYLFTYSNKYAYLINNPIQLFTVAKFKYLIIILKGYDMYNNIYYCYI